MQFTKKAFNFRNSRSYRVPYRSRAYSKKFKFYRANSIRKNHGYYYDGFFGYLRMGI